MITDNYIKMCEQAEEIQKVWKPKIGDIFFTTLVKSINIYVDGFAFLPNHNVSLSVLYIWLPIQEQLQDMYGYKMPIHKIAFITRARYLIDKLYNFEYNNEYTDMNELWLAFVMHEKYNKIWTGEKWIYFT